MEGTQRWAGLEEEGAFRQSRKCGCREEGMGITVFILVPRSGQVIPLKRMQITHRQKTQTF